MPQVTSEDVFNKHAESHGLPLLGSDGDPSKYIDKHATTDETARCFKEAFDAARVADHVGAAHWLAQARHSYLPPARTKTRG